MLSGDGYPQINQVMQVSKFAAMESEASVLQKQDLRRLPEILGYSKSSKCEIF